MSPLAKPATEMRREQFAAEIDRMTSMPGVEAILLPLLSYLQRPFEQQDMQRIVDLISHDNSLAAQSLHMANSPLFGRWQAITSVRAAVVALGLQRMRDIAVSCCVLKLLPEQVGELNPVVFWEHSLGCALLARRLAKRIGVRDPEQVYLAGLLHDLGFMVELQVAAEEVRSLLRKAQSECCPLYDLEDRLWGCTHCDTGSMLARKWNLSPFIADVIKYHHRLSAMSDYRSSVALVSLCDLICRANDLGLGYREEIVIDWKNNELLDALKEEWPLARTLDWPSVSAELINYVSDVRKLVSVLFRMKG
jgi:putative nucleotidyltransferase with HDIG domain